jgi:choline dehydrogenase-like flavoprotein
MILDFESHEVPSDLEADLCIVGAGAVGLAVALEFTRTRHRVVVLEGGGEEPEPHTQGLYQSDLRGVRCSTVHDGRARIFGGTTTMWAGQALPLEDIDLVRRDWVEHSGWPISFSEIGSYIPRAERLLRLPEVSYDELGWPPKLPQPPEFDGLRRRFSTFSPTPNLARAYRSALAGATNVTVLLHANVTRVSTVADNSSVEAVEVRSLLGRSGRVHARRYVLCCGGVETPRLLLASRGVDHRGVGNGHDLVGRFFQEHPNVKVPVVPRSRRRMARMFHTKRLGRVRHFAKLGVREELQRSEGILNVGGDLCYDVDANAAVGSVRVLVDAIRARDLERAPRAVLRILGHPGQLLAAAVGAAVLRQKPTEGFGTMYLCVQTEAAPNPDSRVMLGARTDALGVPRAVVDWRIGEPELRTAEIFARRVDAGLRAHGLGHLDLSGFPLERDLERLSERVAGGCHHIGTTRMSNDPRNGVVDRNCRVHGVDNLFVAGSSVFSTGGWSNPTLTLLALGYRLSDRLKEELP